MRSRQIQWAHSVLNDPSATEKEKRRAASVLAKHDPEGLEDHDYDEVRSRGDFTP